MHSPFRRLAGFEPVPRSPSQARTAHGGAHRIRSVKDLVDSKPKLLALGALLVSTSCGVVAAKAMLEPVTWIEALYFAVSTITTVGYGDYNPAASTRHKHAVVSFFMLFHMGYIVVGVGSLGAAMALLIGAELHASVRSRSLGQHVLRAAAAFALLVATGAIGMCWLEQWDALRGAYWAVVTLSTVGYGHLVPQTDGGRLFASVFMLVGLACEATLFSGLAMLPLIEHRRSLEQRVLRQFGERLKDEKALHALTAGEQVKELGLSENDLYVTRDEFCLSMLVCMEKISAEELHECQAAFDKLDVRKHGRLDRRSVSSRASSRRTESQLLLSARMPPPLTAVDL